MEAAKTGGEFALRVGSAALLAPIAVGIAYVGGWAFVAFWGIAAILVLWEWTTLVSGADRRALLIAGGAAVVLAVVLAATTGNAVTGIHTTRLLGALTVLAIAVLGAAALSPREHRIYVAGGIPYAGVLGVAPIILRSDVQYGFLATIVLFAIVWSTDILAYFVGRALGGPKLAPRISPKKTWSGALGGTVAAVCAAIGIALAAGLSGLGMIAIVALALSVVAQAGDLFESALKRKFGAKDSSHLIPGHGGLMDRLDGFVAAAALAMIIGVGRGGLEAPGRGLLVW